MESWQEHGLTVRHLAELSRWVPQFLRRREPPSDLGWSSPGLSGIMASTLQVKPSALQPDVPFRRSHRTWSAIQRMLGRVRKQWEMLGFFEINEQHDFFALTCMLKEGLRASLQKTIDEPVSMESRKPTDFKRVFKQIHEGFEMRTYAAPVFARFRQYLGMVDTDFQMSLSCESSYLQFISNSKSSADFFLTFDKRYFLKTQQKREIQFLLAILPKYLEHLERYPHSILVKFLGVYSIIAAQEKKRYFIIMQSVFYPHEKITERYDIKGCEVGRWTEPAPEGSEVIVVFKDCNFGNKVICLDEEHTWLIEQVDLDTKFLKALHVIDYSLLVALQPVRDDDRVLNKTLGNILARTRLSINYDYMPFSISSGSPESRVASNASTSSSSYEHFHRFYPDYLSPYLTPNRPPEQLIRSEGFMRNVVTPYLLESSNEDLGYVVGGALHSCSSLSDFPGDSFASQHRRVLPPSKNPLHTFDGPDYRYYIGIIDFFTVYNFRKKVENLWKSIRFRRRQFSTVEPSYYAQRFCQWVEGHVV